MKYDQARFSIVLLTNFCMLYQTEFIFVLQIFKYCLTIYLEVQKISKDFFFNWEIFSNCVAFSQFLNFTYLAAHWEVIENLSEYEF